MVLLPVFEQSGRFEKEKGARPLHQNVAELLKKEQGERTVRKKTVKVRKIFKKVLTLYVKYAII